MQFGGVELSWNKLTESNKHEEDSSVGGQTLVLAEITKRHLSVKSHLIELVPI